MSIRQAVALILGIIMIIGGICCIASPVLTFLTIPWILAVIMIVEGIGSIISWRRNSALGRADWFTLVGAIISIILGVIVCCSEFFQIGIAYFTAYMTAIWVIVTGVFRIISAVNMRKVEVTVIGTKVNWIPTLVIGILLIVLGIICFFNPVGLMFAQGLIIGICILFSGFALFSIAFV